MQLARIVRRPDCADGARAALEAVADHQAHIPDTAFLIFRQDPQPVLRSLPVAVLAAHSPARPAPLPR